MMIDNVLETVIDNGQKNSMLEYIDQLRKDKQLSPSAALYFLCKIRLAHFNEIMARLANTSSCSAKESIITMKRTDFQLLYKQAHMPERYFPAVYTYLTLALKLLDEGIEDRQVVQNRIMEKISEENLESSIPELSYLMVLTKTKIDYTEIKRPELSH